VFLFTVLLAGALVGQPEASTASGEPAPTCWFGDAYAAAGGEFCQDQTATETPPEPAPEDPEDCVPNRWGVCGSVFDAPAGAEPDLNYQNGPVAGATPDPSGCERTVAERRDPVTGQIERSVGISCVGGSDDPRAREEVERLRRIVRPSGEEIDR